MENFKFYLKKFENAAAILFVGLVAMAFIAVKLVGPKFSELVQVSSQIGTQRKIIKETNRKLEDAKAREAKETAKEESKGQKGFYRPIDAGSDTESIMSQELSEILKILTNNKIKTRAIKYEYDSQQDNFVKNVPDRYSACTLDIDIVADYGAFLGFIRDLYKHQYFLNIVKVEIVPYRKNNRILHKN